MRAVSHHICKRKVFALYSLFSHLCELGCECRGWTFFDHASECNDLGETREKVPGLLVLRTSPCPNPLQLGFPYEREINLSGIWATVICSLLRQLPNTLTKMLIVHWFSDHFPGGPWRASTTWDIRKHRCTAMAWGARGLTNTGSNCFFPTHTCFQDPGACTSSKTSYDCRPLRSCRLRQETFTWWACAQASWAGLGAGTEGPSQHLNPGFTTHTAILSLLVFKKILYWFFKLLK